MKNKQLITAFLLTLALIKVNAQISINVSGGNASGNGGSSSYSIGQVVCHTNISSNVSVAEGIQQPYEISVVTFIDEAKNINLSISTYPNPTTDYLTLEVYDFELLNLYYQLSNVNGKLIQSGKISEKQTIIAMQDFIPSTYFLRIFQGNKKIKTFKIIKN